MARPFLEETIDLCARYGSNFSEIYAVSHTRDRGGNTYSHLLYPYPELRYDLDFSNHSPDDVRADLIDLYHRSFGTFGGFRLRNINDYSTNNYVDTPSFNDQLLIPDTVSPSPERWQLVRWYGTQVMGESPLRIIRKPVPGSVAIGIRDALGNPHVVTGWSVDTTTGIVTLLKNERVITNITTGSSTVITVGSGHAYTVGNSVVIYDVLGMVEINGLRGTVTAITTNTITVDINSTTFSAYISGGETDTALGAGEFVTGGCYFDIPVRFESDLTNVTYSTWDSMGISIYLVEILNP